MWKQRFPVKQECKVDVRKEVEEWVITLAFPNEKRLNRGATLPGIYSFLPTETVTNFPFIIQADFLLASSRENILWDNKWNKGILDCVPIAFLNAFVALVKSTENAPTSSLPHMFRFLPINESSHPQLNHVRDAIKGKLMHEAIVPCESYTGQKLFSKPCEVGRLKPAFWSILKKAMSQGVSFHNISSHGVYLLSYSFEEGKYNSILKFLEIEHVGYEWYVKCIGSSNLVMGVSEDLYIELLIFLAENWSLSFQKTNIKNIPILKYVGCDGNVSLCKIGTINLITADSCYSSWLINWNKEFLCCTGQYFLPKATQEAAELCSKKQLLSNWLRDDVKAKHVTVGEFAQQLLNSLNDNAKLVVTYAHFIYHSTKKNYLVHGVRDLCSKMPLVDNYGRVTSQRSEVLVPANESKWVKLIGSNPWRQQNYIELGEDYLHAAIHAGISTPRRGLVEFLETYVRASDVPRLSPPNAAIPTLTAPLTKDNAFLLLSWLRYLRTIGTRVPEKFMSSIKGGSWLKISLSGCPGHRAPSESFMLESSSGNLLQNGSVLVDIPLIDQNFYGSEINRYKEELRTIGVRFEVKDACQYIGERLLSLAGSSTLTRDNVISILSFIKYLRVNYISPENFICSIQNGNWLRTSRGDMQPRNSVLSSKEWNAALQISDIPFIDQNYYGQELLSYTKELELLGVVVNYEKCYQLVVDNLRSSRLLTSLSCEAVFLVLNCIRSLIPSDKIVQALKGTKCLKTNLGYRCPAECFLVNPESEWGCLLQVFSSFPVLDQQFYGRSIYSFANELKKLGVMVDFEDASKEFARTFKQQASSSSISKENVLSFMISYRKLKTTKEKFSSDLKSCIRQEKWLRTRLGDYRSPTECILYSTAWEYVSRISLLPFVDDSDKFYGMKIHEYRTELKQMGVVTELKDGAKFVAAGLFLPPDSNSITPASVYALLDCVKYLKEKSESIPEKKVASKWLKTRYGYMRPDQCLLFDTDWDRFFKSEDGPFIDEEFYGPKIRSYKEELCALGVIVAVNKGCNLFASYLKQLSNFETISRIYNYLCEFKWNPVDEDEREIWIPKGTNNGEWVKPQDLVLHDNNNLFGDQLNVLEKVNYEKKLLDFFANIFQVKVHPSVDDYCKLWKAWESSGRHISNVECCAFWEFVVRNWNSKTEDTFTKNLLMLPVLDLKSKMISLFDKRDIFIADDLFLMDLFETSSSRPLFVWYPQPSSKSLPRAKLVDIYSKLGVRTLSVSAQKEISAVDNDGLEPVDSRKNVLKRGFFKLILGFLSDVNLKMEAERRHEAASRLLALETFETRKLMKVRCSLSFSSGDVVNAEASRMIRWDKSKSKLFMQKMERGGEGGHRNVIEYASHFGEVIGEGVLWGNEEFVPQLSELIRLGFLVEFDEDAVDFIMKTKNLQLYQEDQHFLSSTFSSK